MTQNNPTSTAANLSVSQIVQDGNRLTMVLKAQTTSDCVLHWGLSQRPGGPWKRPPQSCWPAGTTAAAGGAVRTPFTLNSRGERELILHLELPCPWRNLASVLHLPRENRWVKNGGGDFCIELPAEVSNVTPPDEALANWAPGAEWERRAFTLDGGDRLAVAVCARPESVRVRLVCEAGAPLLLHWGFAWSFRHEWLLPPEGMRPADTTILDDKGAAETPFTTRDGLQWLELEFRKPEGTGPRGLRFVLFQPEDGAWLKSGSKDIYLPLFPAPPDPRLSSQRVRDLAEEIVGVERSASSWTLMHRFHMCHDLLEGAQQDEDALALLFAWLRYSATRQLDWQRRYNTKPRELAAAQDRLTRRLASVWKRATPGCRTWARLMLTTLGRGGDGQRVRDEILHIMHRNHIKESAGHFIEEWHQKLHNNTTPDDVAICLAYLAFLKCNGDKAAFYRTLEENGVTRDRLKSFERPIKSEPDFYGDRKDALIREFESFLQILKSVHSGTDLESAANAARGRLDGGVNQKLDAVLHLRHNGNDSDLVGAVAAAREGIAGALGRSDDDAALRDLLFLDLALDECLRGAIERQNVSRLDRDALVNLTGGVLRNLTVGVDAEELRRVSSHWAALLRQPRDGREWALHARAVCDRLSRWVQTYTDDIYQRLQPKAEFLGEAFGVEKWVVTLFSQEVIRGGPAFALSLLLRPLDPILRKAAGLGGWQVVSPAKAFGRVRIADSLLSVQEERFTEPTVLVTDRVAGSEEIPPGITAVITSDSPDLVSHSAVRARNAHVLLATCLDSAVYDELKKLKDRTLALDVTPGGDVEYREATSADAESSTGDVKQATSVRRVKTDGGLWAITQDQFTPELVGGKSNNLNGLRGRLPDWIQLPTSLALPFGTCERALADGANAAIRTRCQELIAAAERNPSEALAQLRKELLQLAPPAGLQDAVLAAWQKAGLAPVPWEQAWHTIRRVWASKWNDRAYLSRRARGISHEDLFMAVLVQQVVEADYAYVLHTTNPLTGNRDELFGEVVLGLGETLVGNYPGRALGFVCRKSDLAVEVISYPGKSIGLYGKGVIFRSDSNGEDLEGFAGAGLYDSYLAQEPEHRLLDYTNERLVWDRGWRDELLRSIARIGLEVEKALGSAQDIEGAVAGGKFYVVQTRPQVGLK